MRDTYFEDINELNEAVHEGDRDSDQVQRAIGAATELESLQDRVASMESFDAQHDALIRNSVSALLRVAAIGASNETIADLQSYSQNPDLKTATLESIGSGAVKIWEKIIAAIKRAFEWIKNLFKKLFGIRNKTEVDQEKLEKKIAQIKANAKPVPLKFEYTPIMAYFVDTKLNVRSQHGYKDAKAEVSLLVSKSKEWLQNKGDSKFFKERIGITNSGSMNFAHGSSNLAGTQILVLSQGEMPKTSDQKEMFAWLQTVKAGFTEYATKKEPGLGKEFTVDLLTVDLMAVLDALREHRKIIEDATREMEKIHAAAEEMVKQAERTLDREGRGSDSKKAMDAKMALIRASFMVNGPLTRYVLVGTKICAKGTDLINAFAAKMM